MSEELLPLPWEQGASEAQRAPLQAEIERLKVALNGSEERCHLMFDAKNAMRERVETAERELAEVREGRNLAVDEMVSAVKERDGLRAQLEGMHLILRQLLDLWEAGMPDETARQDMVEAFAAVRATFTTAEARAQKPANALSGKLGLWPIQRLK